jgi:hypothetical protein
VSAALSPGELQIEKRRQKRRIASPSLEKFAPERAATVGELRNQGGGMLQGDR